jgi:predicted SAM-dependent methyltransferase
MDGGMHRKEIITALLDRKGLGLEIGPSIDPAAPKADGYNVHIVDHLSQEELVAKYEGHGVQVENIEPVDFIWRGGSLREAVDNGLRYDWIIASHVIEHLPDLIRFLRDCQDILKPGGVLSLAIPDKRFCFDLLRFPTSTGDLVQAFLEQRVRHTSGQIFDAFAFATKLDGALSWREDSHGRLKWMHGDGFGGLALEKSLGSTEYVDLHGWVFTPNSFRLALHDLNLLGYVTLDEWSFTPTIGCEFFVAFRNQPPTAMPDRLELAILAQSDVSTPPTLQPPMPVARRRPLWRRAAGRIARTLRLR